MDFGAVHDMKYTHAAGQARQVPCYFGATHHTDDGRVRGHAGQVTLDLPAEVQVEAHYGARYVGQRARNIDTPFQVELF